MMQHTRELVPIEALSDRELFETAEAVNTWVNREDTRKLLLGRHLLGVVYRHSGTPTDSFGQLQRSRGVSADDQGLRTFAIHDTASDSVQGMASIQLDLPLWRQRANLPVGLTHNILLGSRVETPRHNVSAWEGSHMLHQLFEDYTMLRAEEPDSWTLEPFYYRRDSRQARTAIQVAGYDAPVVGDAYRFDDGEASWGDRLPVSQLMISQSAQSVDK